MILTAAILLITARTLTSYIEDYASDIVNRLSIVLGVPVDVDSVSAEWKGLGPYVFLDGLRLGEGENLSRISSLVVKPDVVSSLLSWSIIWSRFEVSDMDVHLEELPSGRWSFAGIELGGGGGGAYLEQMILESNRVSVQEARFSFQTLLGNRLELNVHDMSLDYALAFHRLKLEADFGQAKNKIEFIAELTGTAPRLLDLDGLAYLKVDGHDISDLYAGVQEKFWPNAGLTMDQKPSVNVELWANFRAGKQIEWQGTAALAQIPASLLGYESGAPKVFTDLTGGYSPRSLFVNLQNTEVVLFSDTIELPGLRFERSLNFSDVDYSISLPSIQIPELLESVSALPVFTDLGLQKILDLEPEGEIGLLHLDVPNLDLSRWQLSGHLKSVDIKSFRTAPAVKNLNSYFSLGKDAGSMRIESENLSLFYPGVYDHWLEHDRVDGTLSWQIDLENKNLSVFANSLSVLGEHGPVKGGFLADIPLRANHPTGVDLTLFTGIENTSAGQKDKLIPSSLPGDLRSWLDGAVIAADIPGAGFIYRGSTKRGQTAKRTVQLRLDALNAGLKYSDRWPEVVDLDAEVRLSNAVVRGSANSARLLDLDLSDISIELRPITRNGQKTSQLKVVSAAQGASATFLDLVRQYQLRDQLGDSLDILQMNGNARASIELQLPIQKNIERSDIDVQVNARLLNNQLLFVGRNLQLDELRGDLDYDARGLTAEGLRAHLWQKPIEVDLAEDIASGHLAIDVKGAVDVESVAKWLELDFLGRLKGTTSVTGRIEIPTRTGNGSSLGYYHFWSHMQGVSSEFPEPFAKQASKKTVLDVRVELGDTIVTSVGWDIVEGDNPAIASEPKDFLFELRQFLQAEPSGGSFQSARLAFQAEMPESLEGSFSGQINSAGIHLNNWLEVYESEAAALVAGNGSHDYGKILGLKPDLSISTDQLSYGNKNFGSVKASLAFEPGAWQLGFEAGYGAGSLFVYENEQQPLLNITSVDLNKLEHQLELSSGQEAESADRLNPGDIPGLRLRVDSLILDGVERGHWSGTLAPKENALWVGDLAGGLGSALLSEEEGTSSVFWGLDEGKGYYTELDLTFEYADIGDLFRLIEIEPPMNSESGIFYASLNWAGAPYEYANPSGIMGVNAQNGSFHTGDSKVPNTLLKTIGLINVGSWFRRLRLDFDDMTTQGTPYDLIVGDFIVDGDQITTLTPVDVELSSGSMLFDGAIDLDKEEVDARLVVTLPARQNVTWIAALVAGLPAAAGVWLAGKIFDDELDSLSSVSYKVEGSLDEPRVSAEKMFESTITK